MNKLRHAYGAKRSILGYLTVTLALMAVVVGTGACRSADEDTTDTVSVDQTTLEQTADAVVQQVSNAMADSAPLALLKQSLVTMSEVESFKVEGGLTVTAPDTAITATIAVERSRNHDVHVTSDFPLGEAGETTEMILAEDGLYLKMPQSEWTCLTTDQLGGLTGFDFDMSDQETKSADDLLETVPWELLSITSLGKDTIDGVSVEHLRVSLTPDSLQIAMDMLSDQNQVLAAGLPFAGLPEDTSLDGFEDASLDLWIDEAGHTRKAEGAIVIDSVSSVDFTMSFSALNEDIEVQKPTECASFGLDFFDFTS